VRFPFGSALLDAAARLLAPFVLLFAVSVLAHGHDSPGGGFQGGVLFAAGLILVKLVRGGPGRWEIGLAGSITLACSGLAIFAGTGLVALLAGGRYLDYAALPLAGDPIATRVLGTLGIEIGVALTVTGVLLLIFDALAAWGESGGKPS
jgi:multicomponent Na+:H+ antiporter subunit B